MEFKVLMTILIMVLCSRIHDVNGIDIEPTCLSRFDFDYKVLSKLVTLETELSKLQKENERLIEGAGSIYTRWGRSECPGNGTSLVYNGIAGGSFYEHTGAAVNYLCLPMDPIWSRYDDALETGAYLFGSEYEINHHSRKAFYGGVNFDDQNVPCAVCLSKRHVTVLIPARNKCPDGWTMEYNGHLVAGKSEHKAASEYACMDGNAEKLPSNKSNDGVLFYVVEGRCGSLPCPPYVNGREITCAVCTL